MKVIKNVTGSKELAVPLIIGVTTVYVKENIRKVEVDPKDKSNGFESGGEQYIWDETQYERDEYLKLKKSKKI